MADQTKAWTRSEADERAVAEGCRFDLRAAERVRQFFSRYLRHSKGQFAGKPFELLPWQWEKIIGPLFGWKRKDDTRRYRRAGIWVAKKNGKSQLCSGMSLYMLTGDGEPGAEVYNAAADRDQASIVFNEAANMVEASPALSGRLEVIRSTKRIVFRERASWYKALSAEAPTKEGLNWHAIIIDELHAQPNRDLWDALVYGGRARRQPLLITISTAGYDRLSIGYEQYRYAKQVAAGEIIDTSFLPFIAEAEESDDWKSPAAWKKANPSYGVTVPESAFEQECAEATASPAKENAFRRYVLNMWTEQDVRWLSMDRWDECAGAVDPEELEGRDCHAALDLASTTDTASLVLLFPSDDGTYDVLPFFWVPAETPAKRRRENRVAIDAWVESGKIETTDGDVIDYDVIRSRLNELNEKYHIVDVSIDRWNATQLSTQLQGDGFNVIAFGQGFSSMTAPTKELEALILGNRIRHGGNPVLRWMAGNVSVKTDAAGNLKPAKDKSSEKIDGIVALIMALGQAMVSEPSTAPTVEVWG